MTVVKRDGTSEPVHFDKVLSRIDKAAQGLRHVDPTRIAQQVVAEIVDGIHTSKLDELTGEICAMKIPEHPEYGTLAARIETSNLQKLTTDKFSVAMGQLVAAKDVHGKPAGLIRDDFYGLVQKHAAALDAMIVHERDFLFDYFGLKTLQKGYLMRVDGAIVERPQYLWMRVALAIHGHDLARVQETYDLLSQLYFTHATPTLFNMGTNVQQGSSCFLLSMKGDSIDSIFQTLHRCAMISKLSGGIGLAVHNVRASGSHIRSTNGKSSGLVPMLRVFNDTARYVDQAGKRKGSFAIYLEPWHADVESFLQLKKNTGAEEERARDLFLALWVPDLFMKRVEADQDWTLMCPDECPGLSDCWGPKFDELYTQYEREGRGRRTIKARMLWMSILESQIETGVPYLLAKDAANRRSNQQNLGTIKSSNLCVAPETPILTAEGYVPISSAHGQNVRVWNGDCWSEVQVAKTGVNQKLLSVELSNGATITCTPYHKFIISESYQDRADIKNSTRVSAEELKPGMKLKKSPLPVIAGTNAFDINYPYTHGFFCGDGTYSNGRPVLSLYGEKIKLLSHLDIHSTSGKLDGSGRMNTCLPVDMPPKYDVPINSSLECRLKWLAGYLDADGCVSRNSDNESLQASSVNFEFLDKIRLMLTTMGVNAKIQVMHPARVTKLPDGKGGYADFECKQCWRLLISSSGLYQLHTLGFKTHRLQWTPRKPQRNAEAFVEVVGVYDNGRVDDTYCFTEPLNNAGVFNGILLGNCSEICEYTDANEIAVCNLASLGLPRFVENGQFNFDKLREVTGVITRNLNNVIDVNYYPVEETRTSNMRHRPIGIGIQGLADTFAMLKMAFDSPGAAALNRAIAEHMYYAAIDMSCHLAEQHGPYDSFVGSPASQGKFQFDMWPDEAPRYTGHLDWEGLRARMVKYGLRNSLCIALMPTASTSQILGNNESFEPFTSNLYVRRVLAGEFICANKHLVRDLEEIGLWTPAMQAAIVRNKGRIGSIESIPLDIRERYKTVWEIRQKILIDQSRDRAPMVCQSQSLNLFFEKPSIDVLSTALFYGWRKQLVTLNYYIRTQAAKVQAFEVQEPACATCTA